MKEGSIMYFSKFQLSILSFGCFMLIVSNYLYSVSNSGYKSDIILLQKQLLERSKPCK
jgi:hypothetical protein